MQLHDAKAIPDGHGGVVVAWTEQSFHGGPQPWVAKAAAVTAAGTVHGPVGLVGGLIGDLVLGEHDRVLITTSLADGRKAGINLLTTTAQLVGFGTLATREVSTVLAEGGPAPGFLVNYSDGEVQSMDPALSSLTLTPARPLGPDGEWHDVRVGTLLPISSGGVAAEWIAGGVERAAHVNSEGLVTPLPQSNLRPTTAGDHGVVYSRDADGRAVAFSATTGTVLRTYPESGHVVAPLADGGAALQVGDTLHLVEGTGNVRSVEAFNARGWQYWAGHVWVSLEGAGAIVGPRLDRPVYAFFGDDWNRNAPLGNPQGQGGPELPTFTNVVVPTLLKEPGATPGYSASTYKVDFQDTREPDHSVSVSKGKVHTYIEAEATLRSFFDALGTDLLMTALPKRQDAVAFLGHAIGERTEGGALVSPPASVGLIFSDQDLVKLRLPPYTWQWVGRPGSTVYAERVHSRAKVLFIGSCWGGAIFESLWDLPPGYAVIIAGETGESTDLYYAAWAWRLIANRLAWGWTVEEAVNAAKDGFQIPFTIKGALDARITPARP